MPAKKTTAKKAVDKPAEQEAPASTSTTTTAEKVSTKAQVGKETKENALTNEEISAYLAKKHPGSKRQREEEEEEEDEEVEDYEEDVYEEDEEVASVTKKNTAEEDEFSEVAQDMAKSDHSGSIMELLPGRWGEPHLVLEKLAANHHVSLLPTHIINEISHLREVAKALHDIAEARWKREGRTTAHQKCKDAVTWQLVDLYLTIAFKMEYSFVDCASIRRTILDVRERWRNKTKDSWTKIFDPKEGLTHWVTIVGQTRQMLRAEEAVLKANKSAKAPAQAQGNGAGRGATNGRGRGFGRGNGNQNFFRGGRGTGKQ